MPIRGVWTVRNSIRQRRSRHRTFQGLGSNDATEDFALRVDTGPTNSAAYEQNGIPNLASTSSANILTDMEG